ncbi:MAG TPA: amino acid racemase [Steroidobacteraceae bacterium]
MIPLPRSREEASPGERSLGVIAGQEPAASADFLLKLAEATDAPANRGRFNVVLEPKAGAGEPRSAAARQLVIFDTIASFAQRGVGSVVLPCFSSLVFLDELQENSPLPIADLPAALLAHIQYHFPGIRRLGIVTSRDLRAAGVFERRFPNYELLYSGWDSGDSLETACADLASQGAQLILPALSELLPFVPRTGPVPVLDPHRIYANYVVSEPVPPRERPFKLGVVGGVGPAATVDFLHKVVRHTPAHRDQDHLKVLVEQNPQIPDRTGHLIARGPDPTLALYATCRKLQAGEADLIAIPCNTAHAFIDLIQPHLDIPIINMLAVTVSHVRESWPTLRTVGLLATTGTLSTGIYHRALQKQGLRPIVPPPSLQARMMEGIYGPRGIKAGFTSGPCVEDIRAVIEELVQQGVEVIILGCTELPLIFPERDIRVRDRLISLVDPTEILARHCVAHAMTHSRR